MAALMENVKMNQSVRPRNARTFHKSQNGNQSGDVRSLAVLMRVPKIQTKVTEYQLTGNPAQKLPYTAPTPRLLVAQSVSIVLRPAIARFSSSFLTTKS